MWLKDPFQKPPQAVHQCNVETLALQEAYFTRLQFMFVSTFSLDPPSLHVFLMNEVVLKQAFMYLDHTLCDIVTVG